MNTENLEYYRHEKSRLLSSYKKLEEIGLPLLTRIQRTPDWIESCVEELSSNRFKLFIAGQMNCGKSTLGNALLFGKVILPVYDAVMTSSITLIEHVSQSPNGREGFRAEFYSTDEWQQVRAQAEQFERQAIVFNNAIAHARGLGVIHTEIIGSDAQFIEGYDALPEFVTPATKFRKGKYTPFVKSVTIYGNNNLLHDLVVVDTPGTNDPNELRAKLTEDWIRKADAVVFVTYAGQALPVEDINFINRFMLHVPATHRIIAINKVDTIQSTVELEGYLNDLRNDPRESIRQVFSASTPTVTVCALGGLIEGYKEELPELLSGDQERLSNEGFLSPERHGMNNLRAVIEDRLLKNKGEFILLSHRKKVESTFELAINELESDIAQIDSRILDRTRGIEQVREAANAVENENSRIGEVCRKFLSDVDIQAKRSFSIDAKGQIERIISGQMAITKKRLQILSLAEIQNDSDWIQKDAIENSTREFATYSEGIWGELHEEVALMIQQLQSNLGQSNFLSDRQVKLAIDKAKLLNLNHLAQDALLTPEQFAEIISKSQNFFARLANDLFSTNFDKDKSIANVTTVIRRSLQDCLTRKWEEFHELAHSSTAEFASSIESEMRKLLDHRKNDLDALIKDGLENENQKARDEERKSSILNEISRISELRDKQRELNG